MSELFQDDCEVIFAYTRKNAEDDGLMLDVSDHAKRNGFKFKTAITSNLFHYLKDKDGNLNSAIMDDIFWMLTCAIKSTKEQTDFMAFQVIINRRTVDLYAIVEPYHTNDPQPHICIMFPEDR